jgi:hypothetical protein
MNGKMTLESKTKFLLDNDWVLVWNNLWFKKNDPRLLKLHTEGGENTEQAYLKQLELDAQKQFDKDLEMLFNE